MISKRIGGVLLIVGTSIGAGMLALPVASASMGFWPSTLLLLVCWFLMTMGALYMTEASLYVKKGQHVISMAAATIGPKGVAVAWVSYVFLLYALLSAYISGGADVLGGLVKRVGFRPTDGLCVTTFTLLFGLVVYQGIRPVDMVNRLLMFGKLGVYVFLVTLMLPKVNTALLTDQHFMMQGGLIMIFITSFGFAIIVPNLRDYFDRNTHTLTRVLYVGSLIPLICYVLWDAVIMGLIPMSGEHGLMSLQQSSHATSQLALYVSQQVNHGLIDRFFNAFTSVCMLTAFLGVSLSLMSFLADGFNLAHQGKEGLSLFLLTFLPPWLVVMYYPGVYLYALSYAGCCCVVLLLFLPAWMCFAGRQHCKADWVVPGGAVLQLFLMVVSAFLFCLSVWLMF